jgi:hypothetical protein
MSKEKIIEKTVRIQVSLSLLSLITDTEIGFSKIDALFVG